jgi:PKD repeat protein
MRSIAALCMVVLLLSSAHLAHASHLRAVDIQYDCLSACTTRVHQKVYRDCMGTWIPVMVNFGGAPGCVLPTPVTPWSSLIITEIPPLCPGYPTQCNTPGATMGGIEEWWWYRDFDICTGTPCIYNLDWSNCCRNAGIDNLNNSGSTNYWVSNTFNNTLGTCNNSPRYSREPFHYACSGQDYDVHVGGTDPDGDSLAYVLAPCMQSSTVPVNYAPGCSATAPLVSWNVSLDPATGILHLQAAPGNAMLGFICVQTEEWRNGVLINTYTRDFQLHILACGANASPSLTAPFNLTGTATLAGNAIYVMTGNALCFDIGSADIDPGQGLTLSLPMVRPAGSTFVDAFNATITDNVMGTSTAPPTGRFCWTPTTPGIYDVMIHVEDDFCAVKGFEEAVVRIHVVPCTATATATVGACPSVNFSATGCNPGPITYQWTGGGGLSSTAASFTHTYASVGSYPWEVIVTSGAVSDTIRDTVDVGLDTALVAFITGDDTLDHCAGRFEDTLMASGISNFLWNTLATTSSIRVSVPGVYSCWRTDAAGCVSVDSVTIGENLPDIAGHVTASTAAPLAGEKVYLIRHDTMAQALIAVDSIFTDANGYYFFCNVVDTLVFLKAAPDSANYPFEMPTYADTTLFWNNAITFYPLVQSPFVHDFQTRFGANPGGPGFIGGLITQGANKVSAVGDPVPGLMVFLRDRNTGDVLGFRISDGNGYFSFGGIPLGDYEIVPDKPGVSTSNVPQLSLTAQAPVRDSLDLRLHSTYLELVVASAVGPGLTGFNAGVSPSPFRDFTWLNLELEDGGLVDVRVLDLQGRVVGEVYGGGMVAGKNQIRLGDGLGIGVYFVEVRVDERLVVMRIVKQ